MAAEGREIFQSLLKGEGRREVEGQDTVVVGESEWEGPESDRRLKDGAGGIEEGGRRWPDFGAPFGDESTGLG